MKHTEHYNKNIEKAKLVEDLFFNYCSRGRNIKCVRTAEGSYDNVKNGIDFYVKALINNVPCEFTVDTKSKYNDNNGDTVSLAYTNRLGKPGTLQTSKCDYYAINDKYDGVDRFYLVSAKLVKDHCYTHLNLFDGEGKGQYYILDTKWIHSHWTYFVTENGYIVKSKYEKYHT